MDNFKLSDGTDLSGAEFLYYQDSDSCQSEDIGQELVIKTDDAGGGPFVIIETKRWSIDKEDIDRFCSVLKNIVKVVEK